MTEIFDAQTIESLLRELGEGLRSLGQEGYIYVVGGAAMALAYGSRRSTRDIDASFREGADAIAQVAADIAKRHDLPPDWINSRASMFISNQPDSDAQEFSFPGLRMSVASPRHLVAMKMRAMRPQDIEDLAVLFEVCGIETPQQAADICEELFDETSVGYESPGESLFAAELAFAHLSQNRRPEAAAAGTSSGPEVWIEAHTRSGRPVRGHWRRRT